ncbi:hypothetical protein ID866_7856 [Astraeus odoratus]|nr:hypothetical protein ID866_7856 [Astraeus odoratus]
MRDDKETIEYFLEEVHTRSKLQHENILPVMGITFEFNCTVSIVEPWSAIGNAHDYVQDPGVDPRPLIYGISRGLQYLHNHHNGPIVHGNLKGTNVLMSDDGVPLLTDFGSSSRQVGSLRWLAPEVIDYHNGTPAADVWAFGMTALELFTRRVPYADVRMAIAIIVSITRGPPERPSDEVAHYRMTDEWWALLRRCWEVDPKKRLNASAIVHAIEVLYGSFPSSTEVTLHQIQSSTSTCTKKLVPPCKTQQHNFSKTTTDDFVM